MYTRSYFYRVDNVIVIDSIHMHIFHIQYIWISNHILIVLLTTYTIQ